MHSLDGAWLSAIGRFWLEQPTGFFEGKPWISRKDLGGIALSERAEEVGFHRGSCPELRIDLRRIEAAHRPAVEAQGTRGDDEVGALQARVPEGRAVDQFRLIVKIYGQPAGDEVLCELVNRIVQLSGRATVLGRVGDDIFAMVLPGFDRFQLARAGVQIREVVEATKFAVDETDAVRITVSVGVASLFTDGTGPNQLLDKAQDAVQQAKTAGRNRVFSTVGPIR